MVKNLPVDAGDKTERGFDQEVSCHLIQEDPLEEGIAIQSRILAWRIPWTEETGGLQSIAFKRVIHD